MWRDSVGRGARAERGYGKGGPDSEELDSRHEHHDAILWTIGGFLSARYLYSKIRNWDFGGAPHN